MQLLMVKVTIIDFVFSNEATYLMAVLTNTNVESGAGGGVQQPN